MKKKKKNTTLIKIGIAATIILLLFIIYLIVNESGITSDKNKPKEESFNIRDECSIIAGKLIHTVNNDGECVNRCVAQCETYGLEYNKIEFIPSEQTCYGCECFCN